MSEDYAVFIGDVALDEYYLAPRWPHLNDKIEVLAKEPKIGGMIANAASIYAGYGRKTYFISQLNKSPLTSVLTKALQANGIDTSHIVYDQNLRDSKTIIIIVEGEHTIFIPETGIEYMPIPEETFQLICGAKYIYMTIGSYYRAMKYNSMASYDIIKKARERGAKFVLDLDVSYMLEGEDIYLDNADIIFFNKNGFDLYRKELSYEDAAEGLLEKGVETLVVTLGEEGCRVFTKAEDFVVQGIKVDVVDVTGAGDTFCSSFIFALEEYKDIKKAVVFANFAASRSVTLMGAQSGITNKETIEELIMKGRIL